MLFNKLLIGVALLVGSFGAYACVGTGDFANTGKALELSDLSMSYGQEDGRGMITTLGTLKNSSNSCIEEIVIEVKYFDSKSNLIDVVIENLYGIIIPPSQAVAFRVRGLADKPKSTYFSNEVRVVNSEFIIPRKTDSKKPSPWVNALISWVPFLVLILLWYMFARKYGGKNSLQARTLDLVGTQNTILSHQVKILERLAVAVENKKN